MDINFLLDAVKDKNYTGNFYIVDYLNIFSDYREIIYNKNHIDFHSVKHKNKEQDTMGFFNMFFTKYIYIQKKQIPINSEFIFILKNINNYDYILKKVINTYKQFNIKFILIENEFDNELMDKNKDDFLCQYIYFSLFYKFKNCILISNDKYRDTMKYISLFSSNITYKDQQLTTRESHSIPYENTHSPQRGGSLTLKILYNNMEDQIDYIASKTIQFKLNNQVVINAIKVKTCVRCATHKEKLKFLI